MYRALASRCAQLWFRCSTSFFLLFILSISVQAEQKRILIFYTVGGHAAAAKAIQEDILSLEPGTEIKMVNVSDTPQGFIGKNFVGPSLFLMEHAPTLFSELFFKPIVTSSRGIQRVEDRATLDLVTKTKDLLSIIEDFQPTAVLSTFLFTTETLAYLKEIGRLKNIPVAWLHTDLLDDSYFAQVSGSIEMTFLPHRKLTESWMRRGVPGDRVATTGIAVRSIFHKLGQRSQQALTASVDIADGSRDPKSAGGASAARRPHFILMGGTFGLLDYEGIIDAIARKTKGPIKISAICGKNEKMHKKLMALASRHRKVKASYYLPDEVELNALGWVDAESLQNLLGKATAVVTKPGGITTFEMIFGKIPSIVLADGDGHEAINAKFLAEEGAAFVAQKVEDVGDFAGQIEADPRRIETVKDKQEKFVGEADPHLAAKWALNPIFPKSAPVPPGEISEVGDTIRSLFPTNNWLCRKAVSIWAGKRKL